MALFYVKGKFSEISFNIKYYAHGHVREKLLSNRTRRGIMKYSVGKCASYKKMKGVEEEVFAARTYLARKFAGELFACVWHEM